MAGQDQSRKFQLELEYLQDELALIEPGEECEDTLSYIQSMSFFDDLVRADAQGLLPSGLREGLYRCCAFIRDNRSLLEKYYPVERKTDLDLAPYPERVVNQCLSMEEMEKIAIEEKGAKARHK